MQVITNFQQLTYTLEDDVQRPKIRQQVNNYIHPDQKEIQKIKQNRDASEQVHLQGNRNLQSKLIMDEANSSVQPSQQTSSQNSMFIDVKPLDSLGQLQTYDDLTQSQHHRTLSMERYQWQGFYRNMIPAFTNESRKKAYFMDAKRGFRYVNWDIEDELKSFQREIEIKFKNSLININFRFPRHQNQIVIDQQEDFEGLKEIEDEDISPQSFTINKIDKIKENKHVNYQQQNNQQQVQKTKDDQRNINSGIKIDPIQKFKQQIDMNQHQQKQTTTQEIRNKISEIQQMQQSRNKMDIYIASNQEFSSLKASCLSQAPQSNKQSTQREKHTHFNDIIDKLTQTVRNIKKNKIIKLKDNNGRATMIQSGIQGNLKHIITQKDAKSLSPVTNKELQKNYLNSMINHIHYPQMGSPIKTDSNERSLPVFKIKTFQDKDIISSAIVNNNKKIKGPMINIQNKAFTEQFTLQTEEIPAGYYESVTLQTELKVNSRLSLYIDNKNSYKDSHIDQRQSSGSLSKLKSRNNKLLSSRHSKHSSYIPKQINHFTLSSYENKGFKQQNFVGQKLKTEYFAMIPAKVNNSKRKYLTKQSNSKTKGSPKNFENANLIRKSELPKANLENLNKSACKNQGQHKRVNTVFDIGSTIQDLEQFYKSMISPKNQTKQSQEKKNTTYYSRGQKSPVQNSLYLPQQFHDNKTASYGQIPLPNSIHVLQDNSKYKISNKNQAHIKQTKDKQSRNRLLNYQSCNLTNFSGTEEKTLIQSETSSHKEIHKKIKKQPQIVIESPKGLSTNVFDLMMKSTQSNQKLKTKRKKFYIYKDRCIAQLFKLYKNNNLEEFKHYQKLEIEQCYFRSLGWCEQKIVYQHTVLNFKGQTAQKKYEYQDGNLVKQSYEQC